MSRLMTQALIFEKYGIRLNTDQLAELLSTSRGSVLNQISAGTFPIPTYMDMGRRWADYQAVALHIDTCASLAA